ncbi:putative zinc metalloprotease ywhC [Listeria floridensis FSL S10-1187]|uniref:Zinc metalloprotease ywhC n=1 Tax=Listeria floridensis FSL S10-1187 TaxID=1265817 RepID=A0ABN0RG00_9LIST|nr:putative zinc metalloprotease ywhC [Listeria floridensis FSL S10-1187]
MSNFLAYPLETLPYVVLTILIAFTVHEWAHAFVALLFGDDTAKNEGRLSPNPLVHVDIVGLLMVVIVGFGWAKPTPVNRFKLKKRRLGSILVSLAGPLSNLLLAFIGLGIFMFLMSNSAAVMTNSIWSNFFTIFIQLNLVLAVFNLIPFPPLDGYHILVEFLPQNIRRKLEPFEQYAFFNFFLSLHLHHCIILRLDQFFIQSFHSCSTGWQVSTEEFSSKRDLLFPLFFSII